MKRLTALIFSLIITVVCANAQENVVKVQNWMGMPTLIVNGQPNAGMTYMTYRPQERYFREFGKAGVPFVSFETSLHSVSKRGGKDMVWVSRDSFNFALSTRL